MAEASVVLVVHGFVQGVGYRDFVKRLADSMGVKGSVKNQDDGSVLIVASAERKLLDKFEDGINISTRYGAQVLNVEKSHAEAAALPENALKGFRIKK
ncbi:MAG: acylphosphatase [Candidatus Micrarchaeaceae archaeon]